MRAVLVACALIAGACKFDPLPRLNGGGDDGGPGGDAGIDACTGIGCNIETCNPGEETTISGTVFMPNGLTPLANVDVYVPNDTPGPLTVGSSCTRCGPLPGAPIRRVRTGTDGRFSLVDVPAGANIPLVITIGKWRRQIVVPQVNKCEVTTLPATATRLPKNRTEGDMPRLAVVTGQADALECVVRKIGIDDAEFGVVPGPQAVHLYAGTGGADRLVDNTNFQPATSLWSQINTLTPYDAVLLSCEGNTSPASKPQTAMNAMKAYADAGGRIFAVHFHSIWIGGELGNPSHAPPVWRDLAQFDANTQMPVALTIDMSHTQGTRFAEWQNNVAPSGTLGRIQFTGNSGRSTVLDILDPGSIVTYGRAAPGGPNAGRTQLFSFDTPVEGPDTQRCGRVVFSDMHQASSPNSSITMPFPSGCGAATLAPQDYGIAYMLFELQQCVGTPP